MLNKFNEDLNEYIDLEDISLLKDKSKSKILDLITNVVTENRNIKNSATDQLVPIIEDTAEVDVLDIKLQWPTSISLPIKFFGAIA